MFGAINCGLKRYAPGFHHVLKHGVYRIGLPLPKMLWGGSQSGRTPAYGTTLYGMKAFCVGSPNI